MPIISSSYRHPPFYLFNGHLETIVPSLKRTIKGVEYQRERIDTPDDDFLDIDWSRIGSRKLVVVSHGLEGDSSRHYVKGVVKLFNQNGWDALAWNNRSCSGEMNRQRILYHHGASYDLRAVVNHAAEKFDYHEVALVGVSMGGGQTLRYLGEWESFAIPANISKAVTISVPCSLLESAATLNWRSNRVYRNKFVEKLKLKIVEKAKQYPDIDVNGIDALKTLDEFDEKYTAPIHGFESAEAFYDYCNPFPFLKAIQKPTLILNALNDPLLQGQCYPYDLAKSNEYLFLETPKRGGHVGYTLNGSEFTYAELRALEFITE